jgi:hypothetical protein
MAEWFKAAVLKTVERKLRGFKSYSLRQKNSSDTFEKWQFFKGLVESRRDGRAG